MGKLSSRTDTGAVSVYAGIGAGYRAASGRGEGAARKRQLGNDSFVSEDDAR